MSFVFRLMLFCSLVVPSAFAQQDLHTNPLPSTLGAFRDPRSPRVTSPVRANADRVTKSVDLSEAIAKYAQAKNRPLSQARLETLMFLELAPRSLGLNSEAAPRFKKLKTDVFEITAPESYFTALPAMIRCLEMGKKRVVVHVQTISVAPTHMDQINKFISPNSAAVHFAKMLPVSPVATKDSNDAAEKEFVMTSTTTRESLPVTTAELTSDNLNLLRMFIKQSSSAKILSNPILSPLPGQAASVSDLSYRPFVVGVKTVEGKNGLQANMPVVQAIEDGTTVRVKAMPDDQGRIQLMTDIVISKVTDVNEFTYPHGPEATTIQVPKQSIRQVHMSTAIAPGTTLLVDPNFIQELDEDKDGVKLPVKRKFLLTMHAEIVDMEDETPSFAFR